MDISIKIIISHGIIKIGLAVLTEHFFEGPSHFGFSRVTSNFLTSDPKKKFYMENNETKVFSKKPMLVSTNINFLFQWESSSNENSGKNHHSG